MYVFNEIILYLFQNYFILQHYQPNRPMMVMEYWSGWFDHWGRESIVSARLRYIKERNSLFDMTKIHLPYITTGNITEKLATLFTENSHDKRIETEIALTCVELLNAVTVEV